MRRVTRPFALQFNLRGLSIALAAAVLAVSGLPQGGGIAWAQSPGDEDPLAEENAPGGSGTGELAEDIYPGLVNPMEAERVAAALAGLTERSRMIGSMTLELARTYRRAAQARKDSLDRLAQASFEVDRAAVRPRELTSARLDELLAAEETARLRYLSDDALAKRRLFELQILVAERDALATRIADLRSRLPQERELLTGVWEVTWMPAGTTGTFYLDQSGTLVNGQYKLGTHGDGSLQGTFVGGKLFLQRIDSKRGRDAEIEGILEADGQSIRGTWQSFELVQGGLPRGQWSARRLE